MTPIRNGNNTTAGAADSQRYPAALDGRSSKKCGGGGFRERPILFSGEMVKALLDGRKTQTRRVCVGQRELSNIHDFQLDRCAYGQPRDHLWVRETFQLCEWFGDHWEPAKLRNEAQSVNKFYAADGILPDQSELHWRPSIFMPRWASRITLEIISVRVERLQEITEEGAKAEGVHKNHGVFHPSIQPQIDRVYRSNFAALWDSLNGKRPGCSWDANPFCWVISFRRIKP